MDKNFSTFLDSQYELLKQIVDKLKKHFQYVSLLASDVEGKEVYVSEKNVAVRDSAWQERGFVVRVFKDGLFSEYSFDHFYNIDDICNQIINSVDVKDPLEKSIYVKPAECVLYDEEVLRKTFSKMGEFKDVSIDEIINKCNKIILDSMEEYEYIISASMEVEYVKISKIFISNKKNLRQVYAWANASYQCIVNKNDKTKFNYSTESGVSLADVLDEIKKKINNVNEDATLLLDADYVVPGTYECITSPEVTGLIAHEAFGHGVEMDMFVKNRALGAKYINKKVGSSLVEMHEGAIPYNDVSSYYFDDEGTSAQDTIEIKDGVLQTGIADAISAAKLGIRPTGNGKRENFRHKAYTRMTTTYFASGKSNLKEMIESIDHGYLIEGEMSGMEDPKNWGIQCTALYGREIKDGLFTGKIISPVVMSGYVIDLLQSISMVSNDFEIHGTGSCGKGYIEWVKTSCGGPYLKVRVKLG